MEEKQTRDEDRASAPVQDGDRQDPTDTPGEGPIEDVAKPSTGNGPPIKPPTIGAD